MNRSIFLGFICSLLLISLGGVGIAEEVPGFVAFAQGGEASITDGADGDLNIIIQDIIPYFHVIDGNESKLIPIERLSGYSDPLNAALVFSGSMNESTSLMIISNMSLSDENKTLTLQITPQKFYEGEALRAFTDDNNALDNLNTTGIINTGLYIELQKKPAENNLCYESYNACMNCCNYGMINSYPQTCDYHCKSETVWCFQQGLC